MPSTKKPVSGRRTSLPRRADDARAFVKDWERLFRSGRYDMAKLKQIMLLLIANDEPLGAEYRDHSLQGDWIDHRECHVGGDFLLIYKIDGSAVYFARSGTHAELFE